MLITRISSLNVKKYLQKLLIQTSDFQTKNTLQMREIFFVAYSIETLFIWSATTAKRFSNFQKEVAT